MKGERIMLKKLKVLFMSGLFFLMLMVMPNGALSETFNWKMTSPFPPGDTANQNSDEFAKMVEKNSNGKVKITYYGGTLGSPKDAWDMVATNTVQLIWTGDLYNPGRMPVTQLIALPFEVPDVRNAYNILMELSKAGYLKEYTDAGLKPLYFLPTYPIGLYTTKKKITKLEDFQGMKIRCGTGIQGQALIALGASTVSLPGSEEYMSLQTGVLDGTITGINIGIHRKLHEVIKYSIREPPLFFGVMVMLMNEEAWKSAPPDVQKGIEQAVQEIAPREIQAIVDQEGAMWSEFSKKVDVYSISPEEQARWRKAIGNLAEKHVEELSSKGYPGKEALALTRKVVGR
jgi:TRAP-type C4-dicarboxylate transport system substrate-binding protein